MSLKLFAIAQRKNRLVTSAKPSLNPGVMKRPVPACPASAAASPIGAAVIPMRPLLRAALGSYLLRHYIYDGVLRRCRGAPLTEFLWFAAMDFAGDGRRGRWGQRWVVGGR